MMRLSRLAQSLIGPRQALARVFHSSSACVEKEPSVTVTVPMESLKESMDAKLNAICQKLDAVPVLKESVDAKLNKIWQKLEDLEQQSERMDERRRARFLLERIENDKPLLWNHFEYVENGQVKSSKHIVTRYLMSFQKDWGHDLPVEAFLPEKEGDREVTPQKKAAFREKLAEFFRHTLGIKPRFVENEDGSFAIYPH